MSSLTRAVAWLALMTWSSIALAQTQTRSFVSAFGRDTFPCTRLLPCRTFAGAQTKTAAGGTILVLDPGDYGPVTITKSLTLEAPAGVYAEVTSTGDDGITVSAAATDVVVLRGLTIRGPGDAGIIGGSFGSLHIENCVVHGFSNSGIAIWRAGKATVKDTTVRDCGAGIEAGFAFPNSTGTIELLVEHCRVEKTRVGGAVSVGSGTRATIRDTTASSNQFGFSVSAGTGFAAEMTVENSLASHSHAAGVPLVGGSGLAVFSGGGDAVARVSNTVLVNNDVGVSNSPAAPIYSFGNNKIHGNAQDFVGAPMTPVSEQ